jgi:hypothetical protein
MSQNRGGFGLAKGTPVNVNLISVAYIGHESAMVEAGDRKFIVDERTKVDQAGAKLCPIELIAASLGA